eukprot:356695-Chlamydomonas_euryale.AAC.8
MPAAAQCPQTRCGDAARRWLGPPSRWCHAVFGGLRVAPSLTVTPLSPSRGQSRPRRGSAACHAPAAVPQPATRSSIPWCLPRPLQSPAPARHVLPAQAKIVRSGGGAPRPRPPRRCWNRPRPGSRGGTGGRQLRVAGQPATRRRSQPHADVPARPRRPVPGRRPHCSRAHKD